MNVDLQSISPEAGAKYSPNLRAWLRKNKRQLHTIDAHSGAYVNGEGETTFLGYMYDGDYIGSRLARILAVGAKAEMFCYAGMNAKPIPGFFEGYVALGRCYIDPEHNTHFMGDRWLERGDARTCLWCGLKQVKTSEIRMVVDEKWVAA